MLLDPIRADTGWSESALATSFSTGIVAIGIGSIFGGRLLDRVGSRAVFIAAGVVGGVAFFVAAAAQSMLAFGIAVTVGMGAFGALGFYHVTMTAAVRANPDSPSRAIAILTLWGAFASPIYLPLAAWLVDQYPWRTTLRIIASPAILAFLVAAAFVPVATEEDPTERPSLRMIVAETLLPGPRRLFTIAIAAAGIAMSTVLVYQVPAMTAAGLPLATAATFAAVRGFCQLGGRLPLAFLVDRLGSDRSLILAFGAMAVGGVLLAFAGGVVVAMAFAIVTGFGIGAYSPLQGIKADELFARNSLGTTMGFYTSVGMLMGAIGPALAGILADWTGDRRWSSVIVAITALGACGQIIRLRRHEKA